MIEKISFGVIETDDSSQNSKDIFVPDIESISLAEKSQEVITVPFGAVDMSIGFGTGITTPKIIILQSDLDLDITLGDSVSTIDLELKANESYRLPTGITSITVSNNSADTDATLVKITGE